MKIIECPRDGWQGLSEFIPTARKIKHIEALLKVGFDTVEVGSFVSPKAIPQLKDTAEIIEKIDFSGTDSKIMVLVGNEKGLQTSLGYKQIHAVSFPYSISETFLLKNLNKTQQEANDLAKTILDSCIKNSKTPVMYITMGFGNPYGDEWSINKLLNSISFLKDNGAGIISFTDIVGISTPSIISQVFQTVISEFPKLEFGLHLHSTKDSWYEKVDAAYQAGCRRFDAVLHGMGGCPMTGKELLGNLDTLDLIDYTNKNNINTNLDIELLKTIPKI